MRMQEAIAAGIHRGILYAMLEEGQIERLSRGLYRISDLPALGRPDFTTVAYKAPYAIICLISALHFHEITNEVPHEVQIAIARKATPPRIDYPPTRVFMFSGEAFQSGIETHIIDGKPIRIYSAAKTVSDCFKYRNKIGLDVAIEALRMYLRSSKANIAELLASAKVCRVQKVITPYIRGQL